MRLLAALAFALGASAQQVPFTLDQVLGFSFPTELTAAPAGGKVAWVANARGVRNIVVAEPPRYEARKITAYTEDDGQELQQLRWTPDANAIVYVRGGSANPDLNPVGVSEDVWMAGLDHSAPRKIGEGRDPAISPQGDLIAFTRSGQVWWAPVTKVPGPASSTQAFKARGNCSRPTWSPDGSRLAFTSARGDHTLIGVYDVAAATLRYLDPSTDHDSEPAWSPDSRSIAFIRVPSNGLRPVRQAERTGEPWSIRIASAETGEGRAIWRAHEGAGSVFRNVTAANQLLWAADGRLVFPWEGDGWTHLYSVAATGGPVTLLTPGALEVEDVVLAEGRREVVFSSNQGDIDRRHLWKVAVAGSGAPVALTSGQGIECKPVATSDGSAIAFLRSDAQDPMHPAIRLERRRLAPRAGAAAAMPAEPGGYELVGDFRDLDPAAIPEDFPAQHMVTPQQVIFASTDGLKIHGQLFLPPEGAGVGRAPAVVFFHGGPRRQMLLGWHSMYYYSNAYALNQYLANAGYVVLSVNFRSGTGYGLDFREALHYGASGGAEYNDIQGAGAYLRSRADVDPARIGVWGGSYGGYLVAMALARASNVFKAGVDFHGVHNWATELGIPPTEPDYQVAFESSPMADLKGWRAPVLLIQGDDDPDVQFNQTVRLAGALRRQKVDVEELVFPDEVHDFLMYRSWRDAYQAAVGFLKRKL
ncbi:MAG: prolyl oligopeptidase family serine peptidase [Acidobacteriia bacterium]|nr:prolyl oligopeptidase family serine peptidase [Terriglobia bacterium]